MIKGALKICFVFALILVIAGFVISDENKLQITEIEIYSEGEYLGVLEEGEYLDRFISPGDRIEMRVDVESLFTEDESIDIRDTEVIFTIKNIDDGDDLSDDVAKFKIKPEEKLEKVLDLDIPSDAAEIDYEMEVIIQGEDENGTIHSDSLTSYFTVNDQRHDIELDKVEFSTSGGMCGENINVEIIIKNTGKYEEEDIIVRMINDELGIYEETSGVSLEVGQAYLTNLNFNVPDSVPPGLYNIRFEVYYNYDKLDKTEDFSFDVMECQQEQIPEEEIIEEEEEVIEEIIEEETEEETVEEVIEEESEEEKQETSGETIVIDLDDEENTEIALLIGLAVVIIIVGVVVFALTTTKKIKN